MQERDVRVCVRYKLFALFCSGTLAEYGVLLYEPYLSDPNLSRVAFLVVSTFMCVHGVANELRVESNLDIVPSLGRSHEKNTGQGTDVHDRHVGAQLHGLNVMYSRTILCRRVSLPCICRRLRSEGKDFF